PRAGSEFERREVEDPLQTSAGPGGPLKVRQLVETAEDAGAVFAEGNLGVGAAFGGQVQFNPQVSFEGVDDLRQIESFAVEFAGLHIERLARHAVVDVNLRFGVTDAACQFGRQVLLE